MVARAVYVEIYRLEDRKRTLPRHLWPPLPTAAHVFDTGLCVGEFNLAVFS